MAAIVDKAALRRAALARRADAHAGAAADADAHLSRVLAAHRGVPLAGYSPMRSEIDPLSAMTLAAVHGPVAMPVIVGQDQPLQFRAWTADTPMVAGMFGASVPQDGTRIVPQILIVPLVAFDLTGARLGYGGGFYDRTLAVLRRDGPVLAIGFAYDAQQVPHLPQDATDQRLDMIVTPSGILLG